MVEFYRVEGSLATISMIGSFLIVMTFAAIKQIRKFPTNLIFYMAICDFFFSLKFVLSSLYGGKGGSDALQDMPGVCYTQAIFAQFFGTASVGWIGMIAINLVINLRNPFANAAGYQKFYHAWVWAYATATTIAMLAAHQVGRSGDGTCWIPENPEKNATNLFQLMFFIPLLIYFIIAIMALVYASVRTRDTVVEAERKINSRLRMRMTIFVIVFIVFWIGPIVHRIYQYFNIYHQILQYWDAIGVSLQGAANAAVWLSHPLVFRGLRKNVLRRFLLCCKEQERVPLLDNPLLDQLEDPSQDIQQLDILLRKNTITSILIGIKQSVEQFIKQHADDSSLHSIGELPSVARLSSDSIGLPIEHSQRPEDTYLSSSPRVTATELPPLKTPDPVEERRKRRSERLTRYSTSIELYNIQSQYVFSDYAPKIFDGIRKLSGISREAYLKSLAPEAFLGNLNNQKFSEGKSGSFFCFSPNKNFIMKTISAGEAKVLKDMLPAYYRHLADNPNSMLTRLYGLHSVTVQGTAVIYVIIMSNLFNTTKKIHEKYDIKGSWISRSVKEHEEDPSVLGKDTDMKRKLRLSPEQKTNMISTIEKDVRFLASQGIMDYSLLIGYHFPSYTHSKTREELPVNTGKSEPSISINTNESADIRTPIIVDEAKQSAVAPNEGIPSEDNEELYFVGLIDILQSYNFDKKLERFFKVYFLRKNAQGLSVQPTDVYCERFINNLYKIME